MRAFVERTTDRAVLILREYFARAPSFGYVLPAYLFLCLVLYTRSPVTNFIFDEQEALLANPYVNGRNGLAFKDAIHVDFWGLPPDRSVGSYRPLPNYFWRMAWALSH